MSAAAAARPRVVFLTADLALAGAERQLVEIAARMPGRGFDARVICFFAPRAYVERLRDAGVPVTAVDARRGRPRLADIARLAGAIRSAAPDVLVTFTFPANILGRVVGRILRVPAVVTSLRSTRFGSRLRERTLSWTGAMSAVNVVNSERAAGELIRRGIVAADRVVVIPNGIDLPAWDAQGGEATTPDPGAAFQWIAVGRLEAAKDYPTLIDACGILRDEGLAFEMSIAGEGPLRDTLAQRVLARDLRGVVTLLGLRRDVPRLLARADALVLSSAWEGSPNAVLEAMASRLPVVATDVGGVRDLLGGEAPHLVVAPGDSVALAQAMKRMMSRAADDRRALGRMLRARADAHHDIGRIADAWEGLLRGVLARPG